MTNISTHLRWVAKIIFAVFLLTLLAVVAGSQLTPKVPFATVLLYATVGVLGVGALLLAATVLSLTVRQWVLRNGGSDTQWFWFPSDPPGLQRLRGQQQAEGKERRAKLQE